MRKIIFLICFTAIYMLGCNHDEHKNQEGSKFIATSPVQKDTLIYHEYVCQIRSIQHIELRALEKGYLQNVYVDEGQLVKKGQLLFQIMPSIYQAEMQKALAEVKFVEIEYKNTLSLADSNIVSQNELALAKARLDKAKAELSLAQTHLGFTEIRAPFDGLVGHFQDVRLGSLVDEGDLLTTLSDNSKMWVYFNVPEAEYLNYSTRPESDSLLSVKLKMANNQLFDGIGIVETIESDFNNETGNIAFRATFQNTDRILRHGQTGNVLMPVTLKNVLLIPQKATFEVLDKIYVYVIDQKDVLEARQIQVGAEVPHLYAVTQGLTEDNKILVEGLRKVKNAQKVEYDFQSMQSLLAEMNGLHAE